MSATSDAVLAAGPSVVALAAIWSAWRQQTRSFDHARSIADLADTRAIVDAAAIALHRAVYARSVAALAFLEHRERMVEREPKALDAFADAGQDLDRERQRLAVRLGVNRVVVQRFDAANDAFYESFHAFHDPQLLMAEGDPNQTVQRQGERLEVARAEFMRAAVQEVGAKLP